MKTTSSAKCQSGPPYQHPKCKRDFKINLRRSERRKAKHETRQHTLPEVKHPGYAWQFNPDFVEAALEQAEQDWHPFSTDFIYGLEPELHHAP